jgi:hypothetical protein
MALLAFIKMAFGSIVTLLLSTLLSIFYDAIEESN